MVKAGEGFDYVFGGAGDDDLFAGDDISDGGLTDFNLLVGHMGDDRLHGGSAKDVMLGDALDVDVTTLTQFAEDMAQQRFRVGVAFEPVGTGDDELYGGDGFDVLIGGGGDDVVNGQGGVANFLLGDIFRFRAGVDIDFAPLLDADLSDFRSVALGLIGVATRLTGELTFDGAGRGDDTLLGAGIVDIAFGGDGDDLIQTVGNVVVAFGGNGDDTLDALENNFAIGFAGAGQDTVKSPRGLTAVGSMFWGDSLLVDESCLQCNDTMEGGDGVDILIGGEGDDTLDGGDLTDVLLGDSYHLGLPEFKSFGISLSSLSYNADFRLASAGNGKDTLRGGDQESFVYPDVLIGGPNDDTLFGGPGGGLLFGDAPEVTTSGTAIDLRGVNDQSSPASTKRATTKLFELIAQFFKLGGNGNDTIFGGTGLDVIVAGDGNDFVDTGGGLADIAFGNKGNDRIHGDRTIFNLIAGGEGNDLMRGATSGELTASFLFGDTFDFSGIAPGLGVQIDLETPKIEISAGIGGLLATGDGSDSLIAEHGFNFLMGGDGNDTLIGKGVFNVMMGDAINVGADVRYTFSGNPNDESYKQRFRLPGLAGNGEDHIYGGDGANIIIAGDGRAHVFGGNGPLDIVFGNGGNDEIHGAQGFNVLVGGDDDDKLYGGDDMNVMIGDGFVIGGGAPALPNLVEAAENLRLVSGFGLLPDGNGRDHLKGGSGIDVLVGGDGPDDLRGGNGINLMIGDAISLGSGQALDLTALIGSPRQANEQLSFLGLAGNGFDTIQGGESFDIVLGGGGNDTIRTGGGIDALLGNEGNDRLEGGSGWDVLFGGDQQDCVDGGPGFDLHFGGDQADRFVFNDPYYENNWPFTDFDLSEGDTPVASCSDRIEAIDQDALNSQPTGFESADTPPLDFHVEVVTEQNVKNQLWEYQYVVSRPDSNGANEIDYQLLAFNVDVGSSAALEQIQSPRGWQAIYGEGDRQIEWRAESTEYLLAGGSQLQFGISSALPPVSTAAALIVLDSAVEPSYGLSRSQPRSAWQSKSGKTPGNAKM